MSCPIVSKPIHAPGDITHWHRCEDCGLIWLSNNKVEEYDCKDGSKHKFNFWIEQKLMNIGVPQGSWDDLVEEIGSPPEGCTRQCREWIGKAKVWFNQNSEG